MSLQPILYAVVVFGSRPSVLSEVKYYYNCISFYISSCAAGLDKSSSGLHSIISRLAGFDLDNLSIMIYYQETVFVKHKPLNPS